MSGRFRVPATGRHRRTEVRTFTTMTRDLLAMRDWLLAEQITVVGMEATGSYWSATFYLLEQVMQCWLTQRPAPEGRSRVARL